MKSAKPFQNGRSMAVRIPKGFCIDDEKAFIKNSGNTPMLIPVAHSWSKMQSSICDMALRVLLASALLLSAAGANAICAYQPITYGQTVNGSLSITDCTDDVSGSLYYADYYQFTGTAGEKIYIQQSSSTIDPWLALFFPSGDYTNNNNGGGGTTARIPATSGYYTLPESGTYLLEATSNVSNTTGSYTLTLAKEASTTILPSPPTNVTATAGNGSATVSFTPGSIGSGTLVTYWAACGVDNTHLIEAKGSSSPITVTGLTNGTVYYCWALTESTVGYSSKWSTVSNPVTPTAASTASGTAIEFYNSGINHYFMTASSDEAASLDSKPSWGWARTGKTFSVWLTQASAPGNASPVCRFYGLFSNGTVGSHFYTIDQAECAYVKSRLDWGWNYEGNAFYAVKPTGGACPSGTTPVYRAYNNGMGGAPNHRYMTSQTDVNTMVSQGWSSEGIVMCAASGTNSGGTSTIFTLMTNPTDGQILSAKGSDGNTVKYYGDRDANGIPTSIDSISVEAADGKTTHIELDSAKRPKRMRSSDGHVFDLTYDGKLAVVTALSPDTATSVNTTFTLPHNTASSKVPARTDANSINRSAEADSFPLFGYTPAEADTIGVADWVISVKACDMPVEDAFVTYNIKDSNSNELAPSGQATNAGGGKYVASIPTNLKPALDDNKILQAAEAIVEKLGPVCNALDYIELAGGNVEFAIPTLVCPAIDAALLLMTGPGAVPLLSACFTVSASIITYCETLGYDGRPESVGANHESVIKHIINGLKDEKPLPDSIKLVAVAYTMLSPGDIIETTVKNTGPFSPSTILVQPNYGYCDSLLDGTWSGTWNAVGTGKSGCNFTDGGAITITLSHTADQTFYSGSLVNADGVHYLWMPPGTAEHPACSLSHVVSASGTATAKRNGSSVNLSIKGSDAMVYTGTLTLSNNSKTLNGRISNTLWGATGSITLTKQ